MTVSNGGTVNSAVSVVGTLKGNGNIAGYVDSQGIVVPGDSLGALNIIGALNDYVSRASGHEYQNRPASDADFGLIG